MIISLDFKSTLPIYMQIRNQIVIGIADGELRPGERLPTTRALAEECGVNTMTVNKSYQLLKQEGYIETDRRNGALVRSDREQEACFSAEEELSLKLAVSEASLKGISKLGFIKKCEELWEEMRCL